DVSVRKIAVTVLLEFERSGPIMLDGVAETVKRADAGISAPGEDEFFRAACTDQLIVNDVGSHANEGELLALLANDFVSGGKRDEMGKAFHGDGVAVAHQRGDCVADRSDFSHGARRIPSGRVFCAADSILIIHGGPGWCRLSGYKYFFNRARA